MKLPDKKFWLGDWPARVWLRAIAFAACAVLVMVAVVERMPK